MEFYKDSIFDDTNRPIDIPCEFLFVDLVDKVCHGNIRIDERNEINFTIYKDVVHRPVDGRAFHEIVHATCVGGKLTLYQCTLLGSYYGEDLPYETYYCSHIISGEHISVVELQSITKFSVTFDELPKWRNEMLFDAKLTTLSYKHGFDSEPLMPPVKCGDETVGMHVGFPVPMPTLGTTEVRMKVTPWLDIESEDVLTLEQLHEALLRWGDLFTVICNWDITYNTVYVTFKGSETSCRLIRTRYHQRRKKRSIYPHEMFFTYKDVENNIADVFMKWKVAYHRNRPSLRAFSATYSYKNYAEYDFLALVLAIESYAHDSLDRRIINEEQFKSLLSDIKKAIPQTVGIELRTSIIEKMIGANTVSLREYMMRVFSFAADVLPDRYRITEFPDTAIKRIVRARNNFVHKGYLTPTARGEDYEMMHEDEDFMRHIMMALIGKELGIAKERILEAINRMLHRRAASIPIPS